MEETIELNIPLQRRSKRLLQKEKRVMVIYFDFETTGLNPYHSQLLECAFLIQGSSSPCLSSFIRCQTAIPEIVTKITGITEHHVREAPPLSSILSELLTQVYEVSPYRILWVAHNNYGFDEFFWNRYFGRYFDFCENIHLDSMRMAQLLFPDLYSYKLTSLASYLHVSVEGNAHRAQYDTELLQKVMDQLCERYQERFQVNVFQRPEHCFQKLHLVV